ncbi:helix-hairpin-helix domain-containing protein [Halorubrum yunnanense]|uniref:Helix-hairpin-helix domain-containing protein n=1 Tax=Halorubrum yunnanense TaxID=1526162 RepID=A0ABD5YEV0_9EURY|nr:helix-hairpin-helix domain-containing protein [Halorubrum yunnanense]
MALLQKIKEKLGFGTGRTERDDTEAEVTVESDPAAEEAAGSDDREDAEPVAAGTDAAASTESLVDDESEVDEADGADGSEAVEADATEVEETDTSEYETADDDTAAEQAEAVDAGTGKVAVDADDVGTDVEELKGIGPAYAERLAEVGIETVEDLADADAEAVAEGTSVGESRASTWIERASEF